MVLMRVVTRTSQNGTRRGFTEVAVIEGGSNPDPDWGRESEIDGVNAGGGSGGDGNCGQ